MRKLTMHLSALALGAGLGLLSTAASANDGGLSSGGTPRLLRSHASVTMTREVVQMTIESPEIRVVCDFWFTNNGPACTVRMGFPDVGEGSEDPDEEADEADLLKPPTGTFESFCSYVDGKPVKTQLIRAAEEGHYWHVKKVTFPAHGTRHIRDIYSQSEGTSILPVGGKNGQCCRAAYILHTGASWHGKIGSSEIIVTFADPSRRARLRVFDATKVSHDGFTEWLKEGWIPPAHAVVWKGPCTPEVRGNTLRFVRRNWRPKEADDIELAFDYTIHRWKREKR